MSNFQASPALLTELVQLGYGETETLLMGRMEPKNDFELDLDEIFSVWCSTHSDYSNFDDKFFDFVFDVFGTEETLREQFLKNN